MQIFCYFVCSQPWPALAWEAAKPGQARPVSIVLTVSSPLLSSSSSTRLMSCRHSHQARLPSLHLGLSPLTQLLDDTKEGGRGYDLSIFLWLLNVQKGCKNYFTLWRCLTVWERLCCCWSSRVPSSSDKISSPVTDKKSPLHDFIVPTIHHLIENIQ